MLHSRNLMRSCSSSIKAGCASGRYNSLVEYARTRKILYMTSMYNSFGRDLESNSAITIEVVATFTQCFAT
jgi:hypothetical protein